ncbi:class I SAM-dependent methyltransferase [Actinoallomurus purpureus]|uniref:class I SAM-dependent methyltransferase n=1 Tax=Actinoallomurus purpureus TaxID=478114 RepID=UPI002093D9A0|nr:class I SAM-dependent methyltransferase [Actinoallomurus purpureus]MCO6003619.1 class I SAM-dependent methyltransferase [Actinoallomurus purpureus]
MVTNSDDSPNRSLFAGTAAYYARYRPGYPRIFFDDVIERFHLDGTGRLLDLGCGTGQLTIPLSWHVAEAVGMDPEPEMLAEAARQAQIARATNVTWSLGASTDLSSRLGRFRLVTMGRSFHWMDRRQVLSVLAEMVDDGGGLVIANDSCLVRPTTAWQQAVEEVQHRFLGPVPDIRRENVAGAHEPHEMILARSSFRHLDRIVHAFERAWTPEQVIGYLSSTSLPIRRLLGDRQTAFEGAVTEALHGLDQGGRFIEPVALEVLIARKKP